MTAEPTLVNRAIAFLLGAVGSLVTLSIVMLTSATMLKPTYTLVLKQAVACLIGFGGLALVGALDYRRWERWVWWVYGLAVVLLALTISPLGTSTNGAQRWLWGTQPSDFAKPAIILALAWYGARYTHHISSFWRGTVVMLAIPLVPLALILAEPDKGTSALLALVSFLLMLVAGVRISHVVLPVVAVLALFVSLVNSSDYARRRWDTFLNPAGNRDAYYQVQQGLYAFGAGGVDGTGLGQGTFKFKIPEQHTDFIFPVVGEELGLTFTLGVLAAYLTILFCGAVITSRAADRFGELLAAGSTFLIAAQACINMGVVTDLLPNKGMPLPLLSRGGTGVVVMLTLVGILVSVARRGVPAELAETAGGQSNPFAADTDFPG